MKCVQADQFIQTILDGRLSSRERDALDAHLVHCDSCRTAWEEYRRLDKAATDWARRPVHIDGPGDAFTAQVMARIAREAAPSASRRLPPPWYWGAACLLLLALLTGPLLPTHLPHFSLGGVGSSLAALSLRGIGQAFLPTLQDVMGAWQTMTVHPIVLPRWGLGVLAVTLGINAVFLRQARRTASS